MTPDHPTRRRSALLTLAVAAVLSGCDRGPGAPGAPGGAGTVGGSAGRAAGATARVIATSFYPTSYFCGRIGGGAVTVRCPCPEGEDPIFWKPSREAILEYQAAGLVVLNGAEYEKWAAAASLPGSRVVDTSAGFKGEYLTFAGLVHNHGSGGSHSHEGVDGHTWMDPLNAVRQAGAIRDAMVRAWPEESAGFEARFAGLRSDLMALDERCGRLSAAAGAALVMASHPAYGYVSRRYGWGVVDVDLPPEGEPTGAQWEAVGTLVGSRVGARVMLFEQEPLASTGARLSGEFRVSSVVFDPCEQPGPGTYVERMNRNLDQLQSALADAAGTPPASAGPARENLP